jgi:dinuclear metal center YbgI/SA1388 family protein
MDFSRYLDDLLPGSGLTDYCPNGLQVEGKPIVNKVATAVSASLETLEQAIDLGVDALIVHHGLFWQRDSCVVTGVKRKKLALLLENQLSLFAYHLPLDMHQTIGNNWRAAQEMGWTQLQPFGFIGNVPIGVKGEVSSLSQAEFKQKLENYYEHEAHCAWGGKKTIQTAALISGGAYKSITEAIKEEVDAFVTGSFDEPVWHQAFEEKMNFYALGHSATERVGPRALARQIESDLSLPCAFIDIPNPF